MKVGDTEPVYLAGQVVTQAEVTSMEEGIATLRFEGQIVKMTYVTQLAPEAPAPTTEPAKQVIIDEVVRETPTSPVVATDQPSQVGESAAVGGTAPPKTVNEQSSLESTNPAIVAEVTPVTDAVQTQQVENAAAAE